MRLYYTPTGAGQVALHELGEIYQVSDVSQFAPEELPQRKGVTLVYRVEALQDSFRDNWQRLAEIKSALQKPVGRLLAQNEEEVDDSGNVTGDGEVLIDRDVVVVSEDVPEDANSPGVYQQAITITFRYEVTGIGSADTHIGCTFTATGEDASVDLGYPLTFKESRRTTRYNDLRDMRERASGVVTLTGELQHDTTVALGTIRSVLIARANQLKAAVSGRGGQLVYGAGSSMVFNAVVKVDAFEVEPDQVKNVIRWSLTASYTLWPNESSYAAAGFRVAVAEDRETGETTLTLTGKVEAATEALALTKLEAIRSAVLVVNGFTAAKQVRSELDKNFLRVPDTESDQHDANSSLDEAHDFIELSFNYAFRKRANILSYTVQVSEGDDLKSGLVSKTYSGSVVSYGTTSDLAYAVAAVKAAELGDNKHPVKLSSRLTRNDRKIADGDRECVRVDFAYEYQVKATGTYYEVTSATQRSAFDEDSESVSGFIVAQAEAAANAIYDGLRSPYASRIVSGESRSSQRTDKMWLRLEFQFTAFLAKTAGTYAIAYEIETEVDYVALRQTTSVSGRLSGGQDVITAAETGAGGNKLDAFLGQFNLGNLLSTRRHQSTQQVGDGIVSKLALAFTNTYVQGVASPSQIIQCEVSERIRYSGTRWVWQGCPDGDDEPQDVGHQSGSREITGSIVAATETAARAWMKRMHSLPFPTGIGGGVAPGTRYENPPEVSVSWEDLPLSELLRPRTGSGGSYGTGSATVRFVKLAFSFSEVLKHYTYSEG